MVTTMEEVTDVVTRAEAVVMRVQVQVKGNGAEAENRSAVPIPNFGIIFQSGYIGGRTRDRDPQPQPHVTQMTLTLTLTLTLNSTPQTTLKL